MSGDRPRIDKWLWAARFYRTRSLATQAVAGGKVTLRGAHIKPARAVAIGDRLEIRIGRFSYEVEVIGLSNRRGGAADAQQLYRETEASRARREAVAAELRARPTYKGRPTKRDRRALDRFNEKARVRKSAWSDFE